MIRKKLRAAIFSIFCNMVDQSGKNFEITGNLYMFFLPKKENFMSRIMYTGCPML